MAMTKKSAHLCLKFYSQTDMGPADSFLVYLNSIDGEYLGMIDMQDDLPRGLRVADGVVEIGCRYDESDDGRELIDHVVRALTQVWYTAIQRYGNRTIIDLSEKLTELGDPLNLIDNRRLIDRANELIEIDMEEGDEAASFEFVALNEL